MLIKKSLRKLVTIIVQWLDASSIRYGWSFCNAFTCNFAVNAAVIKIKSCLFLNSDIWWLYQGMTVNSVITSIIKAENLPALQTSTRQIVGSLVSCSSVICHLSVLSNSQSIFLSYLFHNFYKKKKKGKGSIPFRKIVRDLMVHYDLVLISMLKGQGYIIIKNCMGYYSI